MNRQQTHYNDCRYNVLHIYMYIIERYENKSTKVYIKYIMY